MQKGAIMKPIIIQGALASEINELLREFELQREVVHGGFKFFECEYKGYPVIISKTKMGEICSAIATSLGIKHYSPLFILNQGTAGAYLPSLKRGDIIIGKSIRYISGFSTEEGSEFSAINPWKAAEYKTIDEERISYDANKEFLSLLSSLCCLKKDNIYFDIIASGDIWTKGKAEIAALNERFGAVCEAMECSGAYMAANSLETPLVSLRVISNNELNGEEYDESAGIIAQRAVIDILDEMIEKQLL